MAFSGDRALLKMPNLVTPQNIPEGTIISSKRAVHFGEVLSLGSTNRLFRLDRVDV